MSRSISLSIVAREDGTVTLSLSPPVSVDGWSVAASFSLRPNSEVPLFQRFTVSGNSPASGMAVLDAGQGIFSLALDAADTSGRAGNLAVSVDRVDSGLRTQLAAGYMTVYDSPGAAT